MYWVENKYQEKKLKTECTEVKQIYYYNTMYLFTNKFMIKTRF